MAWRYRDRETKALTSEADYHRSRSQGGTRFERFSDANWNVKGRGKRTQSEQQSEKPGRVTIGEAIRAAKTSPSKIQVAPKNFQDWQRIYGEDDFQDDVFDGPEYETGVDY